MKTTLISSILLLVSFQVSAQKKFAQLDQELPTPNEYHTASGAPGHNYYQQKADYKMNLVIDDATQKLSGFETITYTNTDIAFSPNVVSSAIIEYKPAKNLSINWLSKYVGRQFLDNTSNNARSLDAFFTNDLRISYAATPRFFKGLEVNLLINNLFNELYEPNGYTFSYFVPGGFGRELVTENFYYPQAGTNFLLGVKMKF